MIKKYVTYEQLQELNDGEKYKWSNFVSKVLKQVVTRKVTYGGDKKSVTHWGLGNPSIPDMIEYLGDDLMSMYTQDNEDWEIELHSHRTFTEKELVDALWETTKYKLNQSV